MKSSSADTKNAEGNVSVLSFKPDDLVEPLNQRLVQWALDEEVLAYADALVLVVQRIFHFETW